MKWVSVISNSRSLDDAVGQACEDLSAALGGEAPCLIFAFVSGQYATHFERLPKMIHDRIPDAVLLGCSAGGVVGGGEEVEEQPGLSLTGAVMPGVTLTPFHVPADVSEKSALWDIKGDDSTCFVLLTEPFLCNTLELLPRLDMAFPGCPVVGGIASGGQQPGTTALFLEDRVIRAGAVGVALQGDVVMDTVVAQGCRPLGDPMFITRGEGHLIYELDGRPAGDLLQEAYVNCTETEQLLFQYALFLGVVMKEGQEVYRQGDFLMRPVTGLDPENKTLAVGCHVQNNQVVQFHLRDAAASSEDLKNHLSRYVESRGGDFPFGALMFSCLARGVGLYGEPGHDSRLFGEHLPQVPLGGFFCNGEIGPIQGRLHVHSYTSSFGLFRSAAPAGVGK